MATPVIISLLVGLVAGGAFMAMWAANRIEEEGVRQFDRGFERGRWLTDIAVAKAIEDQERDRRGGLLVAGGPPSHAQQRPPRAPGPGAPPVPARPPVEGPPYSPPPSGVSILTGGTIPAEPVVLAVL